MENKNSAVKDFIVKSIIADLEEGELTWHKYWNMANSPYNYETCHVYTGLNRLILATRDYEDPRYLTASQAQSVLGGHVDVGEQSIPLVWWHPTVVGEVGKKKTVPFMRYYTVYNVSQIEGVDFSPFKKSPQPRRGTAIKIAREVVKNYPSPAPITIEVNRETSTFYPAIDSIRMPLIEQFQTEEGFYRALFHELAHSTGVENRLIRLDTEECDYTYSKEELIAEIAASFLCSHCGIVGGVGDYPPDHVERWLEVIQRDPHLLISAASQAEKAYQYITGDNGRRDGTV